MKRSSFVLLCLTLALMLLTVISFIAVKNPPDKVTVRMDTNGTAHVWRISLQNQHVREGAFWILGKLKKTETVLMMPGAWSAYTNVRPQIQKVAAEMSAAGLIPPLKQEPQMEPLVLKPAVLRKNILATNRPLVLLPEADSP